METIVVKVLAVWRDGGTIECECVKTGERYVKPAFENGSWYKGDKRYVYDEKDNEIDKQFVVIYDSSYLIDTIEVKANSFFKAGTSLLQMDVVDRYLSYPPRFKIVNSTKDATAYIHENEKIFSRADIKVRIKELLDAL